MTRQRYQELMRNDEAKLTTEETLQGWHFCLDWDGLLINPEMSEYEACSCEDIE